METPLLVAELGPYRLLDVLGVGAMGTVYLAEDQEEGRRVALKVLHPHMLLKRGFFQRFEREAQAGERVSHPNVVRTLDCGIQAVDGTPYCLLVMEYVEGRTLREILGEWGTLPEALVREIALQVAAGLEAIHDAGIVHRDLKPENVLLTREHQVRIMDLGVARVSDVAPGLTQEGQFAGSLCYAAPEQFETCDVTSACDLYSLGVVLYELASGDNPFRSSSAAEVVHAHRERVPPRLEGLKPNLSPFLAGVVATLLAKKPQQRFASAAALGRVLAAGEEGAWWTARLRRQRRKRAQRPRVPVRRDVALVGRTTESAQLRGAWRQACQGDGSAMLLEGEAGIGKTRLVDAFLDEVAEEDAWLLYGSYPPMGIRGALSDALLARFGPGDLEGALRPYFASVPSLLRPLVDAVQSHTSSSPGSLLEGDALHSAFVHLLRALAAERPVLWVVEDLHFAPVEIRALVTALARAVEGHRILLVLTTRSEIPPAELALLASLPHLRHVGLDRLAVRDVVLMLEDALGSVALAERVGIRIAQCTDGVPLFVLETVRNLKTTGALSERPDGTCFVARTWGSLRIPRAVQDLLEERLEQVRGDERTILEMGAVAGHEFDPVLVARALGHPRLEVLQTLAGLERRTGIVRSDEHVFRFDHHQIHELVRSRLSEERQARHHSRLAEALASHLAGEPTGEECHALARHHLLGRTPEEARPYLLPALDHLSRTCGNEFAVDLAERALGASGVLEGAQRVEVLLRLVERLDLLGVRDRQAAAVREAGELAAREGEPLLEARALVAKGRLHLVADEYEEARVACRRALACARRGNGCVERMQAASTLARTLSRQGALAREKRLYEAIGALARVEKDESAEASATINIGTVWMELGHYEEARRCFERGRELAEHGGHLVWCANAMANLQEVRLMQGDLEGAPARSDAYLQLARNLGDRHGEAQGLLQLGRVHATQGDLDAAEDCYERSLALFREIGGRMGRADCLWMLGCLGRRRGEFETARLHLQGSLALAREIRNPLTECKAAGELGRVLVDEGRLESAIALLDRQLELSLEMGIPEGEAMAAGSLADVFLMLGRVEDAQGFARRVQEIAEHFDHPAMHAAAEDLRGRIAWRLDRLDEAEACFTRRLELAQALSEPPLLADAHLALGTLAARRGKVDVAQVELSEAVSLASGAGYAVADVLAKAERACLSEGCREPALAALLTHGDSLPHAARLEAYYRFWLATRDEAYLSVAKHLLDDLVEHAPIAHRERMLERVPLHCDVTEAWEIRERQLASKT